VSEYARVPYGNKEALRTPPKNVHDLVESLGLSYATCIIAVGIIARFRSKRRVFGRSMRREPLASFRQRVPRFARISKSSYVATSFSAAFGLLLFSNLPEIV
jgi:hypothetical protein